MDFALHVEEKGSADTVRDVRGFALKLYTEERNWDMAGNNTSTFFVRDAVITTIIGSSCHFEIAIASAVAMYGVGSYAALGTTMGLFWEVPIMLSLVYLGKTVRSRRFWRT